MRRLLQLNQSAPAAPQLRRDLLIGNSTAFTLSHRWACDYLSQKKKVFLIDCAIRLQMDTIVHLLPAPVEEHLAQLIIQRAFTPYQILDAINRASSSQVNYDLYVLLAPAKQFFDGDVGDQECAFLLKVLLAKLFHFPKQKKILITERESYGHAQYPRFRHQLQKIMPRTWQLNQDQHLTFENKQIESPGEHDGKNSFTLLSAT